VLRALAETAEAVGAASLWVPEHVILTDTYVSRYPYADDGRLPVAAASGGPADPINVLSFLAAVTTRARLGTGISSSRSGTRLHREGDRDSRRAVARPRRLRDRRRLARRGVRGARRTVRPPRRRLRVPRGDAAALAGRGRRVRGRVLHAAAGPHGPKPVQRPHPPILVGGEGSTRRSDAPPSTGRAGSAGTSPRAVAERSVLRRLCAARGGASTACASWRRRRRSDPRPRRDEALSRRGCRRGRGPAVALRGCRRGACGRREAGTRLVVPAEAL
jgi:alkanesulfonate monooxygenase SsuD/methylene tetrahydromethanopterin reductase-like flavin-dependent oxidoreductase (luciferase family)